ncbi:hypothetical protein [Halobellus ruber]|uniref:DNA replication factor GINS n=1 Tax=Halobellus ruber TaxID=2761102 RepID=A0A7J9SEJ1_9EURY|nr:hypothetical protein [Halobellus ruber]MBB6645365.1 hypothetical protein [Halobellus ruber]
MDLDELRSVRRTERQKDSLQHLRDSFYEDVAAYIAERKAERRRAAEAADDPFGDPEVGQLSDEISTAEDVVEAIYERRVGKVVKLASFAAADMSADKSGLTVEERALFDDLVDRIKQNRRTVLDTLAGEGGDESGVDIDVDASAPEPATGADGTATSEGGDAATPAPTESDPADAGGDPPERGPSAGPPAPDDVLAAAMGGDDAGESGTDAGAESASTSRTGSDPDPATPEAVDGATPADRERDVPVVDGAETDGGDATVVPAGGPPSRDSGDAGQDGATNGRDAPHDDRVTLRITADVGKIYGVDEREYDLEREDVVRLPATNAGPLVDRDAAERLE